MASCRVGVEQDVRTQGTIPTILFRQSQPKMKVGTNSSSLLQHSSSQDIDHHIDEEDSSPNIVAS